MGFDKYRNVPTFASLTPVSAEKIAELVGRHPGLPLDYCEFLRVVGWGGFGPSPWHIYSLYSGPFQPAEIYDKKTAERLDGVLLFGDDGLGYHDGFDANKNWRVVEADPSGETDVIADTFTEFIKSRFGDAPQE